MNIIEHMSFWYDWTSFRYIPKSGIVGSWDRLFLNFVRNHHSDFQNGWTSLHSHQQCRSVPFAPHPLQHKLSSLFLILAILTGIRWNLRVVLICISLMAKDFEYFLKCLSGILYASVESSLFRSTPIFFFRLFVLLMTNFFRSLYILKISPFPMWGCWRSFPNLGIDLPVFYWVFMSESGL